VLRCRRVLRWCVRLPGGARWALVRGGAGAGLRNAEHVKLHFSCRSGARRRYPESMRGAVGAPGVAWGS
jgi:hypothetical protein